MFGPTYPSLRPALCAASGWGGGVQAEGISTPLRWRAAPVSQLDIGVISFYFYFLFILLPACSLFLGRVCHGTYGFCQQEVPSAGNTAPQPGVFPFVF